MTDETTDIERNNSISNIRRLITDVYLDIATLQEEGSRRLRYPRNRDPMESRRLYQGPITHFHSFVREVEDYWLSARNGSKQTAPELQEYLRQKTVEYATLKKDIGDLFPKKEKVL